MEMLREAAEEAKRELAQAKLEQEMQAQLKEEMRAAMDAEEPPTEEAVVGPGDVLYLPAFWWHQFEQPFEDSGSVNVWSTTAELLPAHTRDGRVCCV